MESRNGSGGDNFSENPRHVHRLQPLGKLGSSGVNPQFSFALKLAMNHDDIDQI
jgi:hypothetical protein